MEIINEQILDITNRFIESYRNKNFNKLWETIHPEERERIQNFFDNSHLDISFENFVFEILDEKFKNFLPTRTALASNIRENEYGVKFVYLLDEKEVGIYNKPTQLKGIELPIKLYQGEYKMKIYSD